MTFHDLSEAPTVEGGLAPQQALADAQAFDKIPVNLNSRQTVWITERETLRLLFGVLDLPFTSCTVHPAAPNTLSN